jgi:4-aminobutyrate aminotransferase
MASAVPRINTPLPGPKAQAAIERDEKYTSPSYTRLYPLVVKEGRGMVVEDVDGNLFLDFTAGIAVTATGHCHPAVTHAIQDQAAKLLHYCGTDFYYEPMGDLAAKLAAIAPGDFPKRVFFSNSGTEAIEAAIKLAHYHTGRRHIVAFLGGFHGRTLGSLGLTASKATHHARFFPLAAGVHHVGYGSCYRCPYHLSYGSCGIWCVRAIEAELFSRKVPASEVAAIFVEPIQGEGGCVVPPPEFLQGLREICDRHGILLVADEIQTGLGRTGRMFAMEHWGVVPDIVCVAKGLASGLPLGAMIAREDIMTWKPGSHGSTFGGNPVACRAALATIELLESGLVENAAQVGGYLRNRLETLQEEFGEIGQVRGLGLLLGLDFVEDKRSKAPDKDLRERVVRACFERGLLVLGAGESVLRICPPLIVSREEADTAVELLRDAIRASL